MFVLIERMLHKTVDNRLWERMPWRVVFDGLLVIVIALMVWFDGGK